MLDIEEVRRTEMIMSALRASIVVGDLHPDLTVGAISLRRFAPHRESIELERDSNRLLLHFPMFGLT